MGGESEGRDLLLLYCVHLPVVGGRGVVRRHPGGPQAPRRRPPLRPRARALACGMPLRMPAISGSLKFSPQPQPPHNHNPRANPCKSTLLPPPLDILASGQGGESVRKGRAGEARAPGGPRDGRPPGLRGPRDGPRQPVGPPRRPRPGLHRRRRDRCQMLKGTLARFCSNASAVV